MPRGKGVRKSGRRKTSPYKRSVQASEESNPGLTNQQLDDVVKQVSDRVTPQIVEAVQKAIETPVPHVPEGQEELVQGQPAIPPCPGLQIGPTSNQMPLGTTPINVNALHCLSQSHPDQFLVEELVHGFQYGFSLHYDGPRCPTSCGNLKSIIGREEIAWQKIKKEILAGRVAGPFDGPPSGFQLRVSPIGLVPKSDGSWRLIHHLSYPQNSSVNSYIADEFCSVHYTSFDQIIEVVQRLGPNTLMGKMDIKSAFRLLPISPNDFELLGFKLGDKYFYDKCLPMGCAISCSLFEKFSSLLEWMVKQRVGSQLVEVQGDLQHYLDDFFFAGKEGTETCQFLMQNFVQVCSELGVPLAEEKTVLPTPVLTFLGLELDSIEMKVKIPQDKLFALRQSLTPLLSMRKVTLKQLQSLAGSLNFCARAIPPARAFIRRFYDAMSCIKKQHHFIRVTKEMKEDINTWLTFLDVFNGYCSFPDYTWVSDNSLELFTDSAGGIHGSNGGGAYFQGRWAFIAWPKKWKESEIISDITFLELVPVVMAFYIWGSELINKKLVLHTDNKALVSIINKKSSKSVRVMHLLRPFVLQCMFLNIQCKAEHIEGKLNSIADAISRQQWDRFRTLAPQAAVTPSGIPEVFLQLLSSVKFTDS